MFQLERLLARLNYLVTFGSHSNQFPVHFISNRSISMKKLISVTALSLVSFCALLSTSAQAATVGSNFDVTVALTSKCQVKTASTGLAFTYTAFQATASTAAPTAIVFECTRGFGTAPTVILDSGTDATTGAVGASTTGAGVVGGLQYTVAVAAGAVTAGAAATTASSGTSTQYSYAITGSMPALQAGDAGKAMTQVRTLTVTY